MTTSTRRFVSTNLATSLYALTFVAVAHAQPYDHLACYKVKDLKTFTSAPATLSALQSQFAALGCEIKGRARQVCVPVDAAVGPVEGGAHTTFPTESVTFDRICYRVKCSGSAPVSLEMGDGFGTRTIEAFKISTICLPAVVGTTPTTTTTTLPPLPPCVGGGGFPACTGDCSGVGPNHVCDPRNGEGTCACVLPCNLLDPSGGDICGTGGCPVDSSCALITPTNCGCVFDPGS
ncbi:MAG TPA: hypothetical protein VFO62_04160 [Candidatus Binatia bacterium]|nr:hypothetical protein [Candidatus Binatia bacterium]